MRIWIDVEDLFQYVTGSRRPSGIQRLAFELQRAIRGLAGGDRIRFLRHNLPGDTFGEVPWEDVEALFSGLVGHASRRVRGEAAGVMERPWRSRMRRLLYRLPVPIRVAAIRVGRAQMAAVKAQVQAVAALPGLARALVTRSARMGRLVPFADLVAPGDVIAVLGSPWFSTDYAAMLRRARAEHGVKVLLLVYDLIPIRHPEWCDRSLVQTFRRWFDTCLPEADMLFAISRASAIDVARYAAERGIALPGPVRPIPIGTGFGAAPVAASAGAGLPEAGTYALFVSTIEARKNHQVLFRAWRQLLNELPADAVPTLVFAGREGWLVQDLMQQLRNAEWLGGKIVFVEDPSDSELVRLYRGCLFTLFPSLYEGWGLPVTESLAFGKPCIVSNVTSLPESGGTLARYFDPDNLADVVGVIRATIADRADLAAWTLRVEREFRPVSWDASAQALLEHLA